MAYSEERRSVDATRARQGRTGTGLIWVLIIGLALIVIGFAATWGWKANDLAHTRNAAEAGSGATSGYVAPRPDAATRQNYDKGGPVAPRNGGNPS